ncbi:MAG: DUF1553 domain-containing protein [Pirellula sp.]
MIDRLLFRLRTLSLFRISIAIPCLLLAMVGFTIGENSRADETKLEFFESKIRPVLAEHCYSCHNSLGQADSGLVLDWRGGISAGSDTGAIVIPGNSEASRLIAVLKHEIEGLEMPQGGAKLASSVIADFEKWIRDGIVDPRSTPPTREQFDAETSWSATFARRLDWWSLQKIAPVQTEMLNRLKLEQTGISGGSSIGIDNAGLSPKLIDQFIDHDLKAVGLTRQKRAKSEQLVRRLYHNLIGLPPNEFEIADGIQRIEQSQGIEGVVDEIISRPEFGEKWARHWMDWIRYADSHGSEGDPVIDNAWQYRDYLIRAINQDIPYDQMLREHIAGDLLEDPRLNHDLGINESMLAAAHWRMVFHGFFPTDALDEKVRFLDDQINVFSKAFLGLTVSCSRCHDHKFDPISQEDYYALFALLNNSRPARSVIDTPQRQQLNAEKLQILKQKIRDEVGSQWIEDKDRLARDLLTRNEFPDRPSPFRRALPIWLSIKQSLARGDSVESIRQAILENRIAGGQGAKSWSFEEGRSNADWIASGFGVESTRDGSPRISRPGEFRVAVEGDAIITELLPSGIYSGLLSSKHAARLSSIDIPVEAGMQLWGLVRGGGDSTLRGVVQDYPRMGGIYPFVKPGSEWRWERIDMTYWEGDSMHIELAHALDTAMPNSDRQRSWFGVKEIVLSKDGNQPQSGVSGTDCFESVLEPSLGATLEVVANRFVDEIIKGIVAWRDGSMTDTQAVLIEEILQAGLLANRMEQFATERLKRLESLVAEYRNLEREIISPTRVPGLEEARGRKQRLYVRGDHKNPSQIVEPRFLSAFARGQDASGFDRRQLAEALLQPENPLVHRVIVNRVWHHLFGRGLVPTPDNFGRLGESPTHREMLDTLVHVFRANGASLKSFIKFLVLSDTWQTDSRPSEEATRIDPDNRLWSHAMVKRLEAEGIRDSLLRVSGELDQSKYGPTVSGDSNRRGVYVRVQRNSLDPFLRAFDFPEPFATTGRRDATNVPAQSLAIMNDPQVSRLINSWAKRMLEGENATRSSRERLERMFVAALGRVPLLKEVDLLESFLEESRLSIDARKKAATEAKENQYALQNQKEKWIEIARERYFQKIGEAPSLRGQVQPLVRFDFEKGLEDESGKITLELFNGAKVVGGALVVDGKGYAVSSSLSKLIEKAPLSGKTLEAWVQVDGLDQRGGGVISIQSADGARFDSIVFGEQMPRRWMAGSEVFARTKSFNGPEEIEAGDRVVHIAIVYQEDGTIVGYRDGIPYGMGYQAGGVQQLGSGETVLSFGVRHLPASNGKMLVGKIWEARLYDRALNHSEIESSFQSYQHGFQLSAIPELLDAQELGEWQQLDARSKELSKAWESISHDLDADPELQALSEVGRSIFMMKEFLFIR